MLKSFIVVFFFSLLAFFDGVTGQQTFDDHFRGKGRQSQSSTASQAVAQTSAASTAASTAAANGAKAVNNGANNNNNNANTGANTGGSGLSAQVIQSASDSNGNPTNGQSASLTDPQNFVNFCQGKTLTNGQQITAGSCNGIVMGDIPSKNNMISAIILEPQMNVPIAANQDFNVRVQTNNLEAGVFTNPDNTYYAAPQQLAANGNVIGHCHVVIQKMQSFTDTSPPSAATFAFFKGIDDDGNGQGLLQATVTGGLPAGIYRVCTMMGSSNHQPPLMPVAQRGAQEDCTKFQVGGNTNGNANTGNANNGNANNGNANAASTTAANGNGNGNANAQSTAAAANGNGNRNGNGNTQSTTAAANGNGNAQSTTSAAAAAAATATGGNGRKNRPQTSAAAMANENGNSNSNAQGGANSAQGASATSSANNAQMTGANNGRGRGQLLARSPYVVNPDAPVPRFIARNFIV